MWSKNDDKKRLFMKKLSFGATFRRKTRTIQGDS